MLLFPRDVRWDAGCSDTLGTNEAHASELGHFVSQSCLCWVWGRARITDLPLKSAEIRSVCSVPRPAGQQHSRLAQRPTPRLLAHPGSPRFAFLQPMEADAVLCCALCLAVWRRLSHHVSADLNATCRTWLLPSLCPAGLQAHGQVVPSSTCTAVALGYTRKGCGCRWARAGDIGCSHKAPVQGCLPMELMSNKWMRDGKLSLCKLQRRRQAKGGKLSPPTER